MVFLCAEPVDTTLHDAGLEKQNFLKALPDFVIQRAFDVIPFSPGSV